MEVDNDTADELEKRGVLMPVTPAKPVPLRPELNSTNRVKFLGFLGPSDLGRNLHAVTGSDSTLPIDDFGDSSNLKASNNDYEDSLGRIDLNQSDLGIKIGLSSGFCLHPSSGLGSSSAVCDTVAVSNINSGNSAEVLAHDNASLLVSGASEIATSEHSGGFRLYHDSTNVEASYVGMVGLSSSTVSTVLEKLGSKKRGNSSNNMNVKSRKRPKVKSHRPKILDESKPVKIQKSQNLKSSLNRGAARPGPSEKRKYVKKSLKASTNSMTPVLEIGRPSSMNLQTPEPPEQKHGISVASPCENREHERKDTHESLVNLFENNNRQKVNMNFEVGEIGAKSCRKALDFNMENQMEKEKFFHCANKDKEKPSLKWDFRFDLPIQDFESCLELKRILNQYQSEKQKLEEWRVYLQSRTHDINSCIGMKNKSDSSPVMAGWTNGEGLSNYLKVYRRTQRPNQKSLVNLFENKVRRKVDMNCEVGAKSCRRALDFDMENQMEKEKLCHRANKNEENPSFKWDFSFDLPVQDFDSCLELKRIITQYQSEKQKLDEQGLYSHLRTHDLNSCFGMKNKSELHYSPLTADGGLSNCLKVYQRILQPNQCLKNSRKLGPNFPKICKKKRLTRKTRENCCRLWNDSTAFKGDVNAKGYKMEKMRSYINCRRNMNQIARRRLAPLHKRRKRNQGQLTECEKSSLSRILPTGKQIQEAFSDTLSFKCVLGLRPMAVCRRKRSKLSTRKQTLTVGLSNSHCKNDKVSRVIDHELSKTHLDFFPLPRKWKKSEVRRTSQLLSTAIKCYAAKDSLALEGSNDVEARSSKCMEESGKALIESVIQESKPQPISDECTQLVLRDRDVHGALLPYEGEPDSLKKNELLLQVEIDPVTHRMWKLLMENGESKFSEEEEKEKEWGNQREIFRGRVDSFIARMHIMQGNRRFSPWKGSVVDSVVGVYLTQNVSDRLSSDAYMSLRARYPPKSTINHGDYDGGNTCINVSVDGNAEVNKQANDVNNEHSSPEHMESHCAQNMGVALVSTAPSSPEDGIGANAAQNYNSALLFPFGSSISALERQNALRDSLRAEENKFLEQFYSHQKEEAPHDFGKRQLSTSNLEEVIPKEKLRDLNFQSKRNIGKKTGKKKEKQETFIDWDNLRKTYSSRSRDIASNSLDSVDWEAVRRATIDEVADTIEKRGQQKVIAKRIKEFLDRLVKDHGSIDLEWLRDVPPDKAKEYLLSINGLGLKSVECIRLLTLHHIAFPVDTNVGRIAVRLGWVPLKPLPKDVHLHVLSQYPPMDKMQQYLWPRLCNLDHWTLYELHYQLITFGKVFCTKRAPNCNACPMRAECRHYASEFASARLRLPGPPQRSIVPSKASIIADRESMGLLPPTIMPLPDGNFHESGYNPVDCEPVVEFPKSPEPDPVEILVRDIEDYPYDLEDDEIPVIKLSDQVFKENLMHFVDKDFSLQEDDVSQALVALSLKDASLPNRRWKNVNRLRTEHQVYELPDWHPLVERLDKREPDDPSPYLFAISTTAKGKISNSAEQLREPWKPQEMNLDELPRCSPVNCSRVQNHQTVWGTILVPCRTAEKGSFPLNGTYFQVNEVFADDESSRRLIEVPRAWLWNLPTRTLYCGKSTTTIFRGLTLEEIQYCFWRGFICTRGFDRKTGAPKDLPEELHLAASKAGKKKQAKED